MPTNLAQSRREVLSIAGFLGLSRALTAGDRRQEAPVFSAKTLAGETFNNQLLKGKVVLVQFWATWRPYCRLDAGPLDDLLGEFEKDGLVVLAVGMGETKKTVKAFLERSPRKVKIVLLEDTNLAARFDAKTYPQYELIDREGMEVGQQNGAGGGEPLRRLLLYRSALEPGTSMERNPFFAHNAVLCRWRGVPPSDSWLSIP